MPLNAIVNETERIATKASVSAPPTGIATLANITKRYGTTLALDNLSLSLHSGEVVALLGPNGAGKSTAIRLLLGLSSPTSGIARVFSSDPRRVVSRTRVGAMLQVARITETLRVREHLDLFRSYYPHPLPMAEALRIAQLEGIEERLFGQLSGGQKQRLLFALAICGNPDLIFLDEPTVGMDISARHAIWQQIRSFSAQGKTVLLTTHYLEEADALANRIVVINRGRIISEGTPSEIKRATGGRTIRCQTRLSEEFLLTLPTVTNVTLKQAGVTMTASDVETVVREMLLRDKTLAGLEIAGPALEDAFLALTKEQ
jgi:ABC-2 type transport system ATP-binding protein